MRSKSRSTTLTYYDIGATPFFACQSDQRFSYCLYVPEHYDENADTRYPLVVLVHGTERGAGTYRSNFAQFAEDNRCIVLAPLFPANIGAPNDLNNYKMIEYRSIRFDFVLLSMIEEVTRKYRIEGDRFMLHGFSGGGHFAHRFFYLHSHRLRAVSIGAPGLVTLLDESRPWWVGVSDIAERFGIGLDYAAMRRVPVLMVIGGEDKETWEITLEESSSLWMPGANDAGVTRIDRMASLRRSFERAGIGVQQEIVAGVGHVGALVLDPVRDFMRRVLTGPISR